jgi:hypothetical protein
MHLDGVLHNSTMVIWTSSIYDQIDETAYGAAGKRVFVDFVFASMKSHAMLESHQSTWT